MATFTHAQVYQLARRAGLGRQAAITATAIAFAESGGNSDAVGDKALQDRTWGPSIGLWQIRSLRADSGTGRPRDADRLHEPDFNARAMVSISSQGTTWSPWSTYKSGAYRSHLAAAEKAAHGGGGGYPTGPAAPVPTRGTGGVADSGWDWTPLPGDDGLPGYFDDLLGAAGDSVRGAVVQGVVLAALVGLGGSLIVLGAWRAVQ